MCCKFNSESQKLFIFYCNFTVWSQKRLATIQNNYVLKKGIYNLSLQCGEIIKKENLNKNIEEHFQQETKTKAQEKEPKA